MRGRQNSEECPRGEESMQNGEREQQALGMSQEKGERPQKKTGTQFCFKETQEEVLVSCLGSAAWDSAYPWRAV